MTRQMINIPRPLLRTLTFNWDIDWRNQSTPVANDGNNQIVMMKFPRWVGAPSVVLRKQEIAQWRAIRARARGRVNLYRLPMLDQVTEVFSQYACGGVPHSTGQKFSTGQGYLYRPQVVSTLGASAGATSITVTEDSARPLTEGQFLSYDDWPFKITSITGLTSEKTLEIEMPLRKAIPAGARIDLIAYGVFEASDDQMGLPEYDPLRRSTPVLEFREALNR